MLDASALVDEGLAVEPGPETTGDKKAPRIEGLGGPSAEHEPSIFPKQQTQSIFLAPGAIITAGLRIGFHARLSRAFRKQLLKINKVFPSDLLTRKFLAAVEIGFYTKVL